MPAARYWRAVGLQAVGGGALELSALHLYFGGGARVDAAATLTCTFAPASGTLAALQDEDSTTARWLDVSAPGFALVWDFGVGNAQDVGAVRLGAGALYAEWLETLTLQYSSDGVAWATSASGQVFPWPGANVMQDVPADGDPHFDKVSLLLHMNGADGSTTFTDSSPSQKTVSSAGNAAISTAKSKWGGASLLLDGFEDYLIAPAHVDFVFGTGDFTVELWINTTTTTAENVLVDQYYGGESWQLVVKSGKLSWYSSGYVLGGNTAVNNGAWHHVAATRSAGTLRFFVDGVLDGTATLSTNYPHQVVLGIGAQVSSRNPTYDFPGYIDELRITKGLARYTASFAPPTAAFLGGGFGGSTAQRKLGAAQAPAPLILSGGSAGDTIPVLPPDAIHLDRQDANGTEAQTSTTRYRIPGPRWVKEKTASTNVPLRRRVQLYNQRDSRLVREVWSDPVTGEYSFDNIRGDATYFVIAFDHTGHYRAVIADNLTPEPIP